MNVAGSVGVAESPGKDQTLASILRNLDDLVAEARRLSAEIRGLLDRPAFWPDRRRVNVPHAPERRRGSKLAGRDA